MCDISKTYCVVQLLFVHMVVITTRSIFLAVTVVLRAFTLQSVDTVSILMLTVESCKHFINRMCKSPTGHSAIR